jgi:Cu/Ag efflux pump CusA
MIEGIVGGSLRFRALVLALAAGLLVLGIWRASTMPRDVLPEIAPPYVEIQTEALGLSSAEVEQLITVPLEADLLHGVPFLHQIHSESVSGLSSIVLIFEPGTDIYRARQVVAERLTQAHALPQVSKPPAMLQPLSSANRALMVGLSSKDLSLIEMSVLARWTVRPRLLSVPGVANVAIWGQRDQQLQVLVDPERLHEQNVTLQQVIETTGNALWVSPLTFLDASTPGTGGFIDTPNQRLGIQHVLPILSPTDLADVALVTDPASGTQRTLRLADVATVVHDHQPVIGDALVDGGPGLMLVIEKFPSADTVEVTRGVEAALAALAPGLSGVQIGSPVFRPASYLETATGDVALTLLAGLLLIALVLAVLRNDWRVALIAAVTVPLAAAVALIVLAQLGATLNFLVVAGLVLASVVLVDDAVVVFDAVARRLRSTDASAPPRSTVAIVIAAVAEQQGAILFATFIAAAVAAPLLVAEGPLGIYAGALILPYLLAMAASLAVSLTVAPALCQVLVAIGGPSRRRPPRLIRLRERYVALLDVLARRAGAVGLSAGLAAIAAIVLLAGVVAPRVATSPLPAFQEPEVVVAWQGAPSTSNTEMQRVLARVGNELGSLPGVTAVGSHIGRAITSDQIAAVDSAELWLEFDPDADYQRTMARVEAVVAGYPGLGRSVWSYPAQVAAAVPTNTTAPLAVRIYGQELAVLQERAEAVRQAAGSIPGVSSAVAEAQAQIPTLEIQVDLAAAGQAGLTPGEVRRSATTLLSGLVVGSLFEDQKVFDVVVWGVPQLHQSLASVRDLLIDAPDRSQVRLGDVASVEIAPDPAVIRREGVFRYVDVNLVVAGRDPAAVVSDLRAALGTLSFPLEYHAEILDDYALASAAQTRTLSVLAAAIVLSLLLLQATFLSWRLAFAFLAGLPGATLGAAVVAALMGEGLSFGAAAGILAVLAVAARNGTLLIDHLQRGWREAPDQRPRLAERAADRMGPIAAVAIATGTGLLPLVFLGERPGLELLRPMGLVILGGLLTATLFDLFVVPPLYLRLVTSRAPEPEGAPVSDLPVLRPSVG